MRPPRPSASALLVLALGVGAAAGWLHQRAQARCPEPVSGPVVLTGRLLAATGVGSAPLVVEGPRSCSPERVWFDDSLPPGRRVELRGTRREGYGRGIVLIREARLLPDTDAGDGGLRWSLVRHRGRLQERLDRLYGPRGALVSALVLARREGLDGGERAAFARTGIAHLLAISGFHVGVVAGLLLALMRGTGVSRKRAALAAALGSWVYVAFLGFPEAASRAALILSFLAAARSRGRPAARWGPLSAALLLLVASDPSRVTSVGVQLSFLGAAGLLAGSRPVEEALCRWTRGLGPRAPRAALAAGIAATVATLPVVAWHFEEVSLVGIPVTLAASPLVALALPGALLTLVLDPVLPGPAAFLAGGVDLLLATLLHGTTFLAEQDWVSAWIPRVWTVMATAGVGLGWTWARFSGLRAGSRRALMAVCAAALLTGWPLILAASGGRVLELRMLDVGQGDALLLRTPRDRWILVDAGPPPTGRGPGPVVEALVRSGVHRLELLVLTHPDADHFGEAAAVLERVEVGAVMDPGLPAGKTGFVEVLETAVRLGVPWRAASDELVWRLDGVELEVLHPAAPLRPDRGPVDANDVSVVILVRYGRFEALLTGDAPTSVERALLSRLPTEVEVLKVGHHGSRTSTDSLLLARIHPREALISSGRGNRYGHPAPEVVARLHAAGVRVRRTDREGGIRVQARPDGTFRVLDLRR